MMKILIMILILSSSIYPQWITQTLPTTTFITTVTTVNEDIGIIAGNNGALYRTTNAGNNWVLHNSGTFELFNDSGIPMYDGNHIFLVADNGIIRKSTNNGATWLAVSSPSTTNLLTLHFFDNTYGFVTGDNRSLYFTSNGGLNWLFINTPVPSNTAFGSIVFLDGFTGWISGFSVNPSMPHFLKTTDGGFNWFAVNNPAGSSLSNLTIWYDPQNSFYEFWVSRNGIYRSTNLGVNWSQVNQPPGVVSGDVITSITRIDLNKICITTRGNSSPGIFVTTNYGQNWIRQLSAEITDLDLDIYNLAGWAVNSATFNNTIFRTTNAGMVPVSQISSEIPKDFELFQNYPNPFNPSTKISFTLAQSSSTKIIIFDALGREIETILNEHLKAGRYQLDWNAGKLSSGIYFCRVTAGTFAATKKMLLIK